MKPKGITPAQIAFWEDVMRKTAQSEEIRTAIAEGFTTYGMQTFDQALFDLYEEGKISYEDALRNADSVNDLRLKIKLESKNAKNRDLGSGLDHLEIVK